MAKITRSKLKGIVKECLVELLAEGLDSSANSTLTTESRRKRQRKSIEAEEARLSAHRQKFETQVDTTISSATDDPVLRDILADTARTTLQEQIANEPRHSSIGNDATLAPAAPAGAGINLDSIFTESKQDWAQLAFNEKKSNL